MKNQNEGTVREKFKFDIVEFEKFDSIAQTAFISSNDFLKKISEFFKGIYADFEGCILETTNGGEPTVSLIFNHGNYPDDAIRACEPAGGKTSGNTLIDRTRNRDRQLSEGDRYYLTKDGMDGITPYLTTRSYNNGKPNWKLLVSEFQERNVQYMYGTNPATQYTKVSNLSLTRLCGLLFGVDVDDDHFEYQVNVTLPVTNPAVGMPAMMGNANMNYMLTILRVSSKVLNNIYQKLGYGPIMGTRIVR